MLKGKIFIILRSFSDEDLKLFEQFLISPFLNKNTKAVDLFRILKKFHPGYQDKYLTKEYLFTELYGSIVYKESMIRNLLSDLNILGENYLSQMQFKSGDSYDKNLIQELLKRKIYETALKKAELFEHKINSADCFDETYYNNKKFICECLSLIKSDSTLIEKFRTEEIRSIVNLFLLSFFILSLHAVAEEQRSNIKHDLDFFRYILDYFKYKIADFDDTPLIQIYIHMALSIFNTGDKFNFIKAKELIGTNISTFDYVDKKNIYSVLQTICLVRYSKGLMEYHKELLNIYMDMIENNCFSFTGEDSIDLNNYRNVVILSSKLGENDILKEFIIKNVSKVVCEDLKSIEYYSYAFLSFAEKDFERSMEFCSKIDYSDIFNSAADNVFYKNDIKVLMLKCLYELDLTENAFSFIDAHRHFINNSKIINVRNRLVYMNFLNNFTDLLKVKINGNVLNPEELKNKIIKNKDTVSYEWLLEKLDEMENS